MSLEIHYTRRGFYTKDHDTLEEILCFQRRGRVYCFLRDSETKRFIRKLDFFYLQYHGVFEACYPDGCRKGKGCNPSNNLHVECYSYEPVEPRYHTSIEALLREIALIEDRLVDACEPCFAEYHVEPEAEQVVARSIEGLEECYMDRCET